MGMLVDGVWKDITREMKGAYRRHDSAFRDRVVPGDGAGDAAAAFPAASGRYHLYVSLACPWACRTLIVRALKRLEGAIGLTVVSPDMLEHGWSFDGADPLTGAQHLHQLYTRADPHFSGNVTVPILWDTQTGRIVNNESSEIIRFLNVAFDEWGDVGVDLYPAAFAAEIDVWNDRIYPTVNNGVYRAGFATTQAAYEDAVYPLFDMLAELDRHLATRLYLVGERLTEADIRLFTTAIRFDVVYYAHFKCNLARFRDHANLQRWLKRVYATPGIADTVDFAQIKRHYYGSQLWVNPTGIVPAGPDPAALLA